VRAGLLRITLRAPVCVPRRVHLRGGRFGGNHRAAYRFRVRGRPACRAVADCGRGVCGGQLHRQPHGARGGVFTAAGDACSTTAPAWGGGSGLEL
jgi:flavin-dependent dehydrogenase